MMKDQKLKKFEAKVDIGREFFMQAEANDVQRIVVKVSRDYFVELN